MIKIIYMLVFGIVVMMYIACWSKALGSLEKSEHAKYLHTNPFWFFKTNMFSEKDRNICVRAGGLQLALIVMLIGFAFIDA
ncbi:hypothetical protein [Gilvimarinus polysaccharolyticus]|uniref:hypothetical protein n=1 Tax=Gilvimarinus polysaccharolyticus TaxID=863921 RepID=UPI0006738CD9|nr:hypothetical protein [Gilvimarinus polysaccharolyticus]